MTVGLIADMAGLPSGAALAPLWSGTTMPKKMYRVKN